MRSCPLFLRARFWRPIFERSSSWRARLLWSPLAALLAADAAHAIASSHRHAQAFGGEGAPLVKPKYNQSPLSIDPDRLNLFLSGVWPPSPVVLLQRTVPGQQREEYRSRIPRNMEGGAQTMPQILKSPSSLGPGIRSGRQSCRSLAPTRIQRKLALPKRNRPTMKRTHDFDHPARNPS